MPKIDDDKVAKQYLLGELSEEKCAEVEADYLEHDEAFERLGAIEDDLIDAYSQGQLSASDRVRFEQRLLLSSAQRERVEFAYTLRRKFSESDPQINSPIPPRPRAVAWWSSPFTFLRGLSPVMSVSAAAILVIALVVGWWLIQRRNVVGTRDEQVQRRQAPSLGQRDQPVNQNIAQTNHAPSPAARSSEENRERPVTSSNRIVTFALAQGLVRDPGVSNDLVIPGDAVFVRLALTFKPNDYNTYRAELRRPEGNLVWQEQGMKAKLVTGGKAALVLQLTADTLKSGDYVLTLSGVSNAGNAEVVDEYAFRVVRK
jgi:hypothetical protein